MNIPYIFQMMNYYKIYGIKDFARKGYSGIGTGWIKGKNADACTASFFATMKKEWIYHRTYRDLDHLSGSLFEFVPGYEIVGIVEAIGQSVTGVKVGEVVGALTVYGGYSEYITGKTDGITE